jgi:predicted DCC family thiol-disulfide oxidoreductase YuxK
MQSGIRVATPPARPLLVFDGDCNFCTLWVRRWQQMTGDSVDYLPAQDPHIAAQFPEIPSRQYDTAVVFIEIDGLVYTGAEAVFRTWAHNPNRQWLLRGYEKSSPLANLAEWTYRLVAGNRPLLSRLTRWFCKRVAEY